MAGTPTKRQTLPRWHVTQAGKDQCAQARRGAKVIPFPGVAARNASVVTYPAQIVLPARRAFEPVPPSTPRDRRLGFAAAVALTAAGLVLVLI